jgi:ribosomal protein L37AE/L43A
MWRFQFFPPLKFGEFGPFFPKKTFEAFTMHKKGKKKKNQCEFAQKKKKKRYFWRLKHCKIISFSNF